MLLLQINYHIKNFIISKIIGQLAEHLKFNSQLIIFFLHLDGGGEVIGWGSSGMQMKVRRLNSVPSSTFVILSKALNLSVFACSALKLGA